MTPKRPRRKNLFGNPLSLGSNPRRSLPKSAQFVRPTNSNSKPDTGRKTTLRSVDLKGGSLASRIFRRRKFKFSWKKFFITLGVIIVLLILGVSAAFAYYAPQLPNPHKITDRAIDQSTKIVDRNGNPIYTIHGEENRTIVTSDKINPFVKQAVVSTEDASFYKNQGFDIKGILRAAAVHLHLLKRDLSGGGSTITQQYVKNALLTDSDGKVDETIGRKLKELILSVEVERSYSKDEILTGYLNQIPYGNSAYGIESAAQIYFGKSANDLTLAQAATLTAIPNAPTYYSPYGDNLDALFERKDYILDRMVTTGYITKDQAEQAKKDSPSLDHPDFKTQANLTAPHFTFYIKEQLIKYLGGDPQLAEQKLDTGGYTVVTSLDLPTQTMAQQVLSDMGPGVVKNYGATNACITAVDPKTGEILAMAGSIDYNNSKSGNTNFCTAGLQPGSSFKPIVYATAFGPSYHYGPGSITYDVPTDFGGGYKPNDYDLKFRGPITDRNALAGSLNIPAVKNLALVGVNNALNTAKSMGISTLNEGADNYGLSLVLGSGSVEPVEMADAYATFANNGQYTPLRPILKIMQGDKVIEDFTSTASKKALEPEVAYEISSVLSDANAKRPIFGSLTNNLTLPDRPVASKTGTTESFRDAWTVGYTPSIVTAVWVGNNDPGKTMAKGSDGSIVAAPIWNKFMTQYLKGKPVEQFVEPTTIKTMVIDKLSGKLPTDQTPEDDKVSDLFAPWQVPTANDDVHVKVKIDKASGKLATDLTPADQIDEHTFFLVHSEMPTNPNWENPVQDWAKANGGGVLPPTDSDDIHIQGNAPTISFQSPTDGATLQGPFSVTLLPGGNKSISKIDLAVDGNGWTTLYNSPWTVKNTSSGDLLSGSHTIKAIVTNELGMTASAEIHVTISSDTNPPGPVSGLQAQNGSKIANTPIRLSWTNPSDSDLSSVNIYLSSTADSIDLGSKIKSVNATSKSSGSADIDSSLLTPGHTYYLIVRPVDSAGNENQSTTKVSATFNP